MLKKARSNQTILLVAILFIAVFISFILFADNERLRNQAMQLKDKTSRVVIHTKGNTADLEASRAAAQEKEALTKEITTLKEQLVQINGLLNQAVQEKQALQTEKDSLFAELALLKEDLRLWEGKIDRLDERRMVVERRGKGMRELAKRLKTLRIKAQREIDTAKLALGNHGYMTKEGKNTFARDKVVELEKIVVIHSRRK